MVAAEPGRFTIGVFKDISWAEPGLDALKRIGLPPQVLTLVAKESPEAAALIERTFASPGERYDLAVVGPVLARGPLIEAIQGSGRDLPKLGLSRTLRRVGFQPHDGRIFEALTARGGVLVSILSEERAADALAILLSYGGGNAAIGAWTGRL